MANEPGRPEYTDDQYEIWLSEIRPFLERGKSIYRSIELAGLLSKKTTIYEKYKLKDWFSEKVDAYGKVLGEMVNDIVVTLMYKLNDKAKRGEDLTSDELKTVFFTAEKHRSAQGFFVSRVETAKGRPVEEVVDALDKNQDNKDDVTDEIEALNQSINEPTTSPAQE